MAKRTNLNTPRNRARLDGGVLQLYGIVGDEVDGFTDDGVAELLADHQGGPLRVRLNSPGGFVYQGMAIHKMIAERRPEIFIDGMAASIASVIACAGTCKIHPGATMMIHNPWNIAMGDSHEMRKSAEALDALKAAILNIYEAKTGMSRTRLAAMMDEETWLTADEAVEWGFADSIHDTDEPINRAGLNLSILPHVPNHIRNAIMTKKTPQSRREKARQKQAQAQATNERIRELCKAAGHPAAFADRLIDQGQTLAQAQAAIRDYSAYMAADIGEIYGQHRLTGGTPYGGEPDFPQAAATAITKRATGKGQADPQLVRMSLVDIARHCIDNSPRSSFHRPAGNRPAEIIRAALSTSDFPAILEDALRKSLRTGMETENATHRDWVRVSEAQDFRDQKRPILSSAPDLEKVLEGGEYTYGSFSDDGTEFKVVKYGKIIRLTFEALVNDDLDAFSRLAPALGLTTIRKEADELYQLLTQDSGNGVLMNDDKALFHADHDNLATAAAFDANALGSARAKLRRQKDVSGRGWLNLTPRHLLVPPELEGQALKLVSQSTVHISADNTEAVTPRWISDLVVIAEPRLELTNVAILAAPFGEVDHLELATLPDSPELRQRDGFQVDAAEFRMRHAFGAGALDWRGLVRLTITG